MSVKKRSLYRYIFEGAVFAVLGIIMVKTGIYGHYAPEMILRQLSTEGIVVMGLMIVMIGGGIDLSCAGTASLCGVIGSLLSSPYGVNFYPAVSGSSRPLPLFVPILAALFCGTAIGFINGEITARFHIPAFIVTLATGEIALGISRYLTSDGMVYNMTESFKLIGGRHIFGIPVTVFYFAAAAGVTVFILCAASYGRYLFAIGDNEAAAERIRIDVTGIKVRSYMISGIFSAVSGIVLASGLQHAGYAMTDGYEIDAVTICILGGISIYGGTADAVSMTLSMLIVFMLKYAFVSIGFTDSLQQILRGMLIVAILVYEAVRENREKYAAKFY